MPSERIPAHPNSRLTNRAMLSERRCNERRCNHGRRHMDGVSGYAAEAVFTAQEACRYICISRPTLIKLIADGRIRARKIGRGWRILRAEIDRFLRGG